MKKLQKNFLGAVKKLKHDDKVVTVNLQHFPTGIEVSEKTTGENKNNTRVRNDYTKWPVKGASPAVEKKELGNIGNEGDNVSTSSKISLPKFKTKPKRTLIDYQNELYSIIKDQLGQKSFSKELPKENPRYKKLKKLAQKLGLQKSEKDFLKWMTYVNLFLTNETIFHYSILQILPEEFIKIRTYLKSNLLKTDYVEEFWKSIEYCTQAIFSEILTKRSVDIFAKSTTAPIVDMSLVFLGIVWKYFEEKRLTSLLDENLDSIAEVHMETLFQKLESLIVSTAKKLIAEKLSNPILGELSPKIQILNEQLREHSEHWKNFFSKYMIKLDLYEIIYSVWDYEIAEVVKPILTSSIKTLTKVQFEDKYPILSQNFDCARDMSLFSLFQVLRRFASLTSKTGLPNFVHVKGCLYSWFQELVPQWIDIACYRAMTRIEKSVQLDNLEPISQYAKISSSATETVDIFLSMEKSWHDLDWPNPEEAYSFVLLTLKNFDRCAQFYAEYIHNRVQELEEHDFQHYDISDELCIALNNVEFVIQNIESVVENLRISKILEKLGQILYQDVLDGRHKDLLYKQTALQQCINTPPSIVKNWTENVHRRTSCNLISTCQKIEPFLHIYLETAASAAGCDQESDKLISHLNGILQHMTSKLTSSEYSRVFPTIAERMIDSFIGFVERNIMATKSTGFFTQLQYMLSKLCELFLGKKPEELDPTEHEKIHNLKKLIEQYMSSSDELIIQYLQERHSDQNSVDQNEFLGKLTVLVDYVESIGSLQIKLLNATLFQLGDVNSFVKFKVHTKSLGNGIVRQSYCSKVAKKTKCPMFEDIFLLKIPKSEIESGGYIQFCVKHGRVGWWTFVGDSLLPLDRLSIRENEGNLNESSQIKLPITKLTNSRNALRILTILDERKENVKFVRTERQRMSTS